jgi:glutamate racemase
MAKIGVFDSGYGGLTVLKELRKKLPQYDYIYLGDNARTPYGNRSFETVYQFTLQAVKKLFEMDCELVILACNTASAKALRQIQQKDLPHISEAKRVLGVIRPSAEILGEFSKTKHVGILATEGTVVSESYPIELAKFFPELKVFQESCPIWVSLIENNLHRTDAGKKLIEMHLKQLLEKSDKIDCILLGCTHYPLIQETIGSFLRDNVTVLSQGEIVANSLKDYLERHEQMKKVLSKKGSILFYTTDDPQNFENKAAVFYGEGVVCEQLRLT